MKKQIVITGSIGSGKSVVAEALRVMGYAVYDSDREAKRLVNENAELRRELTHTFGNEIYETNGELNKKLFSGLIFGNEANLKRANETIHPAVYRDFDEWAERQPSEPVFIETALYFEGLIARPSRKTREAIVVCAPEALRIERAMKRNHCSEETVRERMSRQMSQEAMVALADWVIWNDEQHSVLEQITNYFIR